MENKNKEMTTPSAGRAPLIALRGITVFPGQTATVDVGRAKSLKALNFAAKGDLPLVVVMQKSINTMNPTKSDLYDVGTFVRIKQILKMPNDNVRVLLRGLTRVRLNDVQDDDEMLTVDYEPLSLHNADTVLSEALLRKARELFSEYALNGGKVSKETVAQAAEIYEPNEFIDTLVHHVVYNDQKKQELLEIADTEKRLEELCVILASEIQIAKLDKRISNRVQSQVDKNQKEFYLREQIRAINED